MLFRSGQAGVGEHPCGEGRVDSRLSQSGPEVGNDDQSYLVFDAPHVQALRATTSPKQVEKLEWEVAELQKKSGGYKKDW